MKGRSAQTNHCAVTVPHSSIYIIYPSLPRQGLATPSVYVTVVLPVTDLRGICWTLCTACAAYLPRYSFSSLPAVSSTSNVGPSLMHVGGKYNTTRCGGVGSYVAQPLETRYCMQWESRLSYLLAFPSQTASSERLKLSDQSVMAESWIALHPDGNIGRQKRAGIEWVD